jgi:ABC-type branched-subunit amino acid transport system substrate-binding protein
VELAIKDTESNPEAALEGVRELDELSVSAIIGPIVTVEAAASEAQARQIPMILLTQKDHVSELGNFIFRNFLTPRMQVKGLVAFSRESLDMNRFAVLYPDEPYGERFMNLFWDEVISAGGTIAGVESYDSGLTDFAAPIKKLVGLFYADKPESGDRGAKTKAYDPIIDFDGLFIPDGPTKAGMIIPQLAYFDVTDIFFLGTNLWHSDKLIRTAGDIAQASIIPDGFFAESENPVVREFVNAYREVFDEPPGLMEAIAYDTAMILFETLNHHQIRIRSAVPDMLSNLGDYPGVTGITNFDATGEAIKGVYILKVRGNRFQELKYP